ncbi:GyrI-like domain-containing protein [Gracilibacillus ureilyticus]|nr:GyrI-like domain-containing protein [Gracilibacillus ureilyticus]
MERVTLNEFTVAGIVVKSDWKGLHQEMPKQWNIFREMLPEIINRKSDKMIDISLDYKDGIYTECICVEISDPADTPSFAEVFRIPCGQYLHHTHNGPVTSIADSFGEIITYAKTNQIPIGHMKIDSGYTLVGNEEIHELYIRIDE